jgi:arylsulfatase A-like enzyme
MNVILIISDTLRQDFLGCYGNEWIHTPYLDRIAEDALVFERAQAGSFPTVPCRHDIMTGRWTMAFKPWSPLSDDQVVLSELLGSAGVVTSCFADVPNAFSPSYNYQRGFHAWEVIRGQEWDNWKTAPATVELPCDPSKLRLGGDWTRQFLRNTAQRQVEEDYFSARTMRAAARWLEENRNSHFFMYVDTFDPHEPWCPPKHYLERYEPEGYEGDEVIYPLYDRWEKFLTEKELLHCRNLYAGEVSLVDRWIGFLVERVHDLGLEDDTAVIITSDHGFYLGEHGYIGKAILRPDQYQSLPLYPEVSNIPLLVLLPHGKPGNRSRAFAQHVDIMPTILELCGAEIPDFVEGRSLVPVFEGQDELRPFAVSSPTLSSPDSSANSERRFSAFGIAHPTNRATITSDDWALIIGAQVEVADLEQTRMVDSRQREITEIYGPVEAELYNLKRDPWCTDNVLAQNKQVAREMQVNFVRFLETTSMRSDHLPYFAQVPREMR